MQNDLLNEHEAARRLGLSVATLRRRRVFRHPPAWVKLGGRVLYRPVDLDAFVEANVVHLTMPRIGKENSRVQTPKTHTETTLPAKIIGGSQ